MIRFLFTETNFDWTDILARYGFPVVVLAFLMKGWLTTGLERDRLLKELDVKDSQLIEERDRRKELTDYIIKEWVPKQQEFTAAINDALRYWTLPVPPSEQPPRVTRARKTGPE